MRKLLLFPLRLCVGWGISPRLMGLIGVAMLVLLRLTIGWHFYSEGLDKKRAGNWSAAPFFAIAKGPYADHFKQMVWDSDGAFRRNMDESMLLMARYRDQVVNHYGFDEKQTQEAQERYAAAVNQQKMVLADNEQDLEEYDLGVLRLKELDDDDDEGPVRDGVSSLGGQRETIRKENLDLVKPTLTEIDTLWENYEVFLNAIATADQTQTAGKLPFHKPFGMNTGTIDRFVPYFDIAIGLCLLLGLFTPLAALAAAGFLASVFLSQYPPTTGPASSNYQLIECMACLVLAGTAAGRFAGLDYFLHMIVRKTFGAQPKKEY